MNPLTKSLFIFAVLIIILVTGFIVIEQFVKQSKEYFAQFHWQNKQYLYVEGFYALPPEHHRLVTLGHDFNPFD